MSDPRAVLIVLGSCDRVGTTKVGLQTTAKLAAEGLLRPLVLATPGPLLEAAQAVGLPTAQLPSASDHRRRADTLDQAARAADLVHALGLEAASVVRSTGVAGTIPLVVTVDGATSHHGFKKTRIAAYSAFRGSTPIRWLVHGRVAMSHLVQAGLVRGDQLVTLPVLPFSLPAQPRWGAARAAARVRLAAAPGAHVVVGIGPRHAAGFRALQSLASGHRAEAVVGVWIDTDADFRPTGRRAGALYVVAPAEGAQLLPGMDVLLADGTLLGARHPGVDARWAGVPIVATLNDVASEFVQHSVNGYVCTPAELDVGIEAAISMAMGRTLHHRPVERRRGDHPGDAAAATARCYSDILGRPLLRPVLIGRGAAR